MTRRIVSIDVFPHSGFSTQDDPDRIRTICGVVRHRHCEAASRNNSAAAVPDLSARSRGVQQRLSHCRVFVGIMYTLRPPLIQPIPSVIDAS